MSRPTTCVSELDPFLLVALKWDPPIEFLKMELLELELVMVSRVAK